MDSKRIASCKGDASQDDPPHRNAVPKTLTRIGRRSARQSQLQWKQSGIPRWDHVIRVHPGGDVLGMQPDLPRATPSDGSRALWIGETHGGDRRYDGSAQATSDHSDTDIATWENENRTTQGSDCQRDQGRTWQACRNPDSATPSMATDPRRHSLLNRGSMDAASRRASGKTKQSFDCPGPLGFGARAVVSNYMFVSRTPSR